MIVGLDFIIAPSERFSDLDMRNTRTQLLTCLWIDTHFAVHGLIGDIENGRDYFQ